MKSTRKQFYGLLRGPFLPCFRCQMGQLRCHLAQRRIRLRQDGYWIGANYVGKTFTGTILSYTCFKVNPYDSPIRIHFDNGYDVGFVMMFNVRIKTHHHGIVHYAISVANSKRLFPLYWLPPTGHKITFGFKSTIYSSRSWIYPIVTKEHTCLVL